MSTKGDPNSWPAGSPERVVTDAFAAVRARDGRALAALATDESLTAYRERVRDDLRPRRFAWSVEQLVASQPDMPLVAAEWQLEQMRRQEMDHEARLLREFDGMMTLADIERASPAELLEAALRAIPDRVVRLAECRALGHVAEGGEIAWVLFRAGFPTGPRIAAEDPWEPAVAYVRREEGAWKLALDAYTRVGIPGFQGVFVFDHVDDASVGDPSGAA